MDGGYDAPDPARASTCWRAIARSELLERVWGLQGGDASSRAVDMHIVNLRDKLGDPSDAPQVVLTVRGKGYMMAAAEGAS